MRRASAKKRLAWIPTSIRAGAVSRRLAKGTLKKTSGVETPISRSRLAGTSVAAAQADTTAAQVIHGHVLPRLFSQYTGCTSNSSVRFVACSGSLASA